MNNKERQQLQRELDKNQIQRGQRLSRAETMRPPMATPVDKNRVVSEVYRECKG